MVKLKKRLISFSKKIVWHLSRFLDKSGLLTFEKKFPQRGTNKFKIKLKLWFDGYLNRTYDGVRIGSLSSPVLKVASDAWKVFFPSNPNNIGNWSIPLKRKLYGTQKYEKEFIKEMIDFYQGDNKKIEGYITSGATEGNIYSVWVGKKYLANYFPKEKVCLVKTSLAHYSIDKAADITGIPLFNCPIDKSSWSIDHQALIKTVEKLKKKGLATFLLPLTLGYTLTGTNDDIEQVVKIVSKLEKTNKIKFFVWIDAALNGLITPFIKKNFTPFSNQMIRTFVCDFHKFGGAPYPAGFILYQKKLRKLVERDINYLRVKDNTLLGSRTGMPAAACWAIIHHYGKEGFRKRIQKGINLKNNFIKQIRANFSDVEIISSKESLQVALIFNNFKKHSLPKNIEKKYSLFPSKVKILFSGKERKEVIYRFYFFPHIDKQTVNNLIEDLKKSR